ncbi:hypothetical protein DFAR_1720003 [Desulfarculales bacterium]
MSQSLSLPEAEEPSNLYRPLERRGLVNAASFRAHSCQDIDRSVELERISGAVLESYF